MNKETMRRLISQGLEKKNDSSITFNDDGTVTMGYCLFHDIIKQAIEMGEKDMANGD